MGRRLRDLNFTQTPREYRLNLAQISYRAGYPEISLKIIHKIIHPDKKSSSKTISHFEMAEYAASLIKVGASTEAFQFLDQVNPSVVSKVRLYRAYAHITEWDYKKALDSLKKYVAVTDPRDYSATVAKVNLAACYVQTEAFPEAIALLSQLEIITIKDKHILLLANVHELLAQVMIATKEFSKAKLYLEKAAQSLVASGALDHLFVKKWTSLLAFHSGDRSAEALEAMVRVRHEARQRGHYETLREMDYYISQIKQDKNLFLKVYYGTPFEAYRASILRRLEFEVNIPEQFVLGTGQSYVDVASALLFRETELSQSELGPPPGIPIFKKGKILHKLLNVLCSDLYRPFRLGSLFSKVYTGEFYDPFGSQERVHQIVKRLRKVLIQEKIDFKLHCENHSFQLEVNQDTSLLLSTSPVKSHHYDFYRDAMVDQFGGLPFSSLQASQVLNISKRLVNKVLLWDEGKKFVKSGSGRSTKYKSIAGSYPAETEILAKKNKSEMKKGA